MMPRDEESQAEVDDEKRREEDETPTAAEEESRSPLDGPGRSGGTAGTGGVNKVQDRGN